MVDKEIYQNSADHDFSIDGDESKYQPLSKVAKSLFYTNLHHDKDFVNVMEIMLGMDTIIIDDSFISSLEVFKRNKNFINVNSNRMLKDKSGIYHSINKPLFIVILGFQEEARKYSRSEYGIFEVIGSVGGFINAVHKLFGAFLFILSFMEINIKLMNTLHFSDKGDQELIDSIFKSKRCFSLSYPFAKIGCLCSCANRKRLADQV